MSHLATHMLSSPEGKLELHLYTLVIAAETNNHMHVWRCVLVELNGVIMLSCKLFRQSAEAVEPCLVLVLSGIPILNIKLSQLLSVGS